MKTIRIYSFLNDIIYHYLYDIISSWDKKISPWDNAFIVALARASVRHIYKESKVYPYMTYMEISFECSHEPITY